MKVMIVVTHLLGAGHLSRAATLARAFVTAGHQALILSGGYAAPHLNYSGLSLVQLPPLASNGTDFTRLLNGDGEIATPDYLAQRVAQVIENVRESKPDVLITELFPFGRRSLSTEFLGLLDASRSLAVKPLILASIRDILAPPSKRAKAVKAEEVLLEYYDGVLVHSDPSIIRLHESWPVSDKIIKLLYYTGFVAPDPAAEQPDAVGRGEVLVSAGSGSVGDALFECAVDAAKLSCLSWRFMVGGVNSNERIEALQRRAGPLGKTIGPVRQDFRQMLTGAKASVSMCGYNTTMDLLQSGCPSVLVPFDDGGEVEQTLRSRALSRLSAIKVIKTENLQADLLASAVDEVTAAGPRSPLGLKMDGARQSVEYVEKMIMDHRV